MPRDIELFPYQTGVRPNHLVQRAGGPDILRVHARAAASDALSAASAVATPRMSTSRATTTGG
eukprot:11220113-Lingulodinium_polyedra.AAC.1